MAKTTETKLYLALGGIGFIAYCVMMIVFGYQHLYYTWEPCKGQLDPIHAGGIICHSILLLLTLVFMFFRFTEKPKQEETKPVGTNPFEKDMF